jgi:LysR family glycine cleavage system transcriptional activator
MFLNSHTLASLRFFAAAARVSSFKQAAMDLHVTQGAVSQQIKQLEGALGVRLFYRLVRQVSLTEEGRQFAAVVERSLEDIERAAKAISAPKSTAEIRLRAGPSFSLRWLVPRLADFYSQHKGIRLFVNAAYGAFDPARREFDLAIEQTKERLPSMHCEVLMDETLTPVCSPEFLERHSFLKKPKDLERCTLLHDGHPWPGADEDAEWRHWLDEADAPRVDSSQGQFFSLANLAIEAALTHQGVAIGRLSLVADLLESRRLVAPFPQKIKSPTRYYLVYPKELAERADIQAVIQWLREQAAPPS